MKTIVGVIVVIAIIIGAVLYTKQNTPMTTQDNTQQQPATAAGPQIVPIEHATAIIQWAGANIYTDPVGADQLFAGRPAADIVLLTDIHGDHLSTSTLSKVLGDAALIVPQAVMDQLPEQIASGAKVLKNGETIEEQGFTITAVPMYNYPETAESRHAKGRGNGYIVERDGKRVYIAGDTGPTPEMKALTGIDIALVPMNMPFTMTPEEAAEAVLAFKPKMVAPYHYRQQGGFADVNKFKELVNAGDPNIDVQLLAWYPQQ